MVTFYDDNETECALAGKDNGSSAFFLPVREGGWLFFGMLCCFRSVKRNRT